MSALAGQPHAEMPADAARIGSAVLQDYSLKDCVPRRIPFCDIQLHRHFPYTPTGDRRRGVLTSMIEAMSTVKLSFVLLGGL